MKYKIYDPLYLKPFVKENTYLDISALVVTYNRAPYSIKSANFRFNPLLWSLSSIIEQKPPIREIIVIDDGSKISNYAKDVVEYLKKTGNIDIRYYSNKNNLGCSISRSIGVKYAKYEYVYFADDDCIRAPFALFGAHIAFKKLLKEGKKVAAINLPLYNRATVPLTIIKKKQIGRIDTKNMIFTSTVNSFPSEYINKPKFIDNKHKILMPFVVKNPNAHLLCKTSIMKKCKFAIKRFNWKNSYAEESFFTYRLKKYDQYVYYLPDPKCHAVHLVYGLNGRRALIGKDWKSNDNISLNEMVRRSTKLNLNTGCRVSPEKHMYSKILALFSYFAGYSSKTAKKWVFKSYDSFVKSVEVDNLRLNDHTKHRKESIWKAAIIEGIKTNKVDFNWSDIKGEING